MYNINDFISCRRGRLQRRGSTKPFRPCSLPRFPSLNPLALAAALACKDILQTPATAGKHQALSPMQSSALSFTKPSRPCRRPRLQGFIQNPSMRCRRGRLQRRGNIACEYNCNGGKMLHASTTATAGKH
jgi:hypothetical protein